jgi:hypothetical protein
MGTNETRRGEGPRHFARFLEGLGDGDAVNELSEQLFKLTTKLQDESLARGDKVAGMLTFKLAISADPRGNVGMVYDIELKEPKPKRVPAIGWLTKGGNVTFEHPKQLKMPLHEVADPDDYNLETGEVTPAREV